MAEEERIQTQVDAVGRAQKNLLAGSYGEALDAVRTQDGTRIFSSGPKFDASKFRPRRDGESYEDWTNAINEALPNQPNCTDDPPNDCDA